MKLNMFNRSSLNRLNLLSKQNPFAQKSYSLVNQEGIGEIIIQINGMRKISDILKENLKLNEKTTVNLYVACTEKKFARQATLHPVRRQLRTVHWPMRYLKEYTDWQKTSGYRKF